MESLAAITGVQVKAVSQPLQTKPVGGPSGQDSYLNAAILLNTILSPGDLHQHLIQIEMELGRQRRQRWGARKVDLDLLLFGMVEMESETLTIPHPRMTFRKFVLDPAKEIAREMIHPTSGLSIGELSDCLSTRDNIVLFAAGLAELNYESAIQSSVAQGWRLSTVFEDVDDQDQGRQDFDKQSGKAKLVCYIANGAESSPFKSHARSFAGPTLSLPSDLEKCKLEVEAAIEAMS